MPIKKGYISNSDLIHITDSANNFVSANVEGALAEISTKINEKTSYGVISGLIVAQQTVANMTVKVSAGLIYMASGERYAPAAVASIAVTAADATNPRIDIIYVSSAGVISYLAGAAGAAPSAPAVPSGGMLLAEIYVAATVETVVTANIKDRRKSLWSEAWIAPTLVNSWVELDANSTPKYKKDNFGRVYIKGAIKTGTTNTVAFTLPEGYRPLETVRILGAHNSTTSVFLFIDTNGEVKPITAYTTYISLDGISFNIS